jgi:hypothetical protein
MWAAIVEWLGAWEKVRVEAERIVDLGDKVLILSRQSAQGKRSGVPMSVQSSDIFTVRDGRIVRWELYGRSLGATRRSPRPVTTSPVSGSHAEFFFRQPLAIAVVRSAAGPKQK